METIINQIIHGIMLGVMYSLVAVGFTLFFGVLNLIQFFIFLGPVFEGNPAIAGQRVAPEVFRAGSAR